MWVLFFLYMSWYQHSVQAIVLPRQISPFFWPFSIVFMDTKWYLSKDEKKKFFFERLPLIHL